MRRVAGSARPRSIDRYRDRLPVSADTPVVSLGEGSTPLLPAPRLGARLGVELWLKWEAGNPTGSFKDRGMTVAVSKALEEGAAAVIVASTGNTASSVAAYAARAGIPAVILQPQGAVATGKLAQTRMYGARVLEVRGSFDEALAAARELAERGTHALVNSINPYRRHGQKTAVFEIVEELGGAPDALYLPFGGGGNTNAYGQGFDELGGDPARLVAAQAADRGAHRRVGDPDRRPGARAGRRRGGRAYARRGRDPHGRADPGGLAGARPDGGALLRARLGGGARGARARAP